MRTLFLLLLLVAGFNPLLAEDPPSKPQGIIILKAVAGYPAAATSFVDIQWVNTDGGYIVDQAGGKLSFVNIGIGRIIYFDQIYYDELDHNQFWLDWRAGLQGREVVIPPPDTITLHADALAHLQYEQQKLADIAAIYPQGKSAIDPLSASIQDSCRKLSSGLVLQNGKWLSAKDAAAPAPVPTIGQTQQPTSFTTKAGKKYENVKVTVSDSGVSVLMADGGASVPFDQLPDDLSPFPQVVQTQIHDTINKLEQEKIAEQKKSEESGASNASSESSPTPGLGIWGTLNYYMEAFFHHLQATFSSSPSSSPASPASSSSSPVAPAASDSAPSPATGASYSSAAVVLIKGDAAQGTGFLARTASGPVVFTNLHVLAANPNFKIFTSSGEQIIPLSLKGASDRDLAMFSIENHNYAYLELAPNVDQSATAGDQTSIPGDSEGGEVTLTTNGNVVGIGPQRVEFSNPIYHGNSGGPVISAKNGKVIAVVVSATRMSPTNDVDQASFSNPDSAIKGSMRYFGLRIDTVPAWENYDIDEFDRETRFLKAFHARSLAIDSLLNGAKYGAGGSQNGEGWPPAAGYFQTDKKVSDIAVNFHQVLQGHSKVSAVTELTWSLSSLADEGLDAVQNTQSFYTYNQLKAKFELAYRSALKTEIESLHVKSDGRPPEMGL